MSDAAGTMPRMEPVHPLAGLDSHPWSSFSHAYGPADDLPDLLRALTGPDPDAAGEALSELYGSVLHQGTVYDASAEAAPFLARIAAAGHHVADVVALLGGLAESEDEHGMAPAPVRAAVAGQLPLLLPLLDSADSEVRRIAAWAVSQTRATALVLPALNQRFQQETEPLVRAAVLSGISRLDPAAGAEAAAGLLTPSQPAVLRMAAIFACLDAELPWTEAHHTTMLSLLPADPHGSDLDLERSEPFAAVVDILLRRDRHRDRESAFALIDTALRDGRVVVLVVQPGRRDEGGHRVGPVFAAVLRALVVDAGRDLAVLVVVRLGAWALATHGLGMNTISSAPWGHSLR